MQAFSRFFESWAKTNIASFEGGVKVFVVLGGLEFMEILQMEAVPITMGSLVLRLILQQVEDVLMVLGDMLKELLMVIIMVFMETHQTILTRVREYLELRPEIIM